MSLYLSSFQLVQFSWGKNVHVWWALGGFWLVCAVWDSATLTLFIVHFYLPFVSDEQIFIFNDYTREKRPSNVATCIELLLLFLFNKYFRLINIASMFNIWRKNEGEKLKELLIDKKHLNFQPKCMKLVI